MAANAAASAPTLDTLITIKVALDGSNRKFKLPLRDLHAAGFPAKLRSILQLAADQPLKLERFSDSSGAYLSLDAYNPASYKQMYRAAKAKLKLRIRATSLDREAETTDAEPKVQPDTSAAATAPTEKAEAPAPKELSPQVDRQSFVDQLAMLSRERDLSNRINAPLQPRGTTWQVFCNSCDKPMADAHFHCSICDNGDYDLCEACVTAGKLCPGDGHWLIKRFIKNGKVVNSTTERAPPKPRPAADKEPQIPGAFKVETKGDAPTVHPSRTCNACVRVLPEKVLVTCQDCDDFDLCMSCHVQGKTGHHPGHTFKATARDVIMNPEVSSLCPPGRNVRHAAICDGCDSPVFGVRHKCLDCPDWDYCNKCFEQASTSHHAHRFVPIYEPLKSAPCLSTTLHYGIYCDGPLCSSKTNQSYIRGIRYKCAVCHDTDFCGNCEAHPSNKHNNTHPLIKFKTQVRNVSITTVGDNGQGSPLPTMGDQPNQKNSSNPVLPSRRRSTDSLPPYSPVAPATQRDVNSSSVVLDAHFKHDLIPDGTQLDPNTEFAQTWILKNPGPHAWPAGCSVKHVGGDNMLNVHRDRPASVEELVSAQESNATYDVTEPGSEVPFTVWMRTPAREGKYISYWRLKAPDGTPFGHKLWCDVEVKSSAAPAQQEEPRFPKTEPSGPFDASFFSPEARGPPASAALADYQMQLMLLDMQNRKRESIKETPRPERGNPATGPGPMRGCGYRPHSQPFFPFGHPRCGPPLPGAAHSGPRQPPFGPCGPPPHANGMVPPHPMAAWHAKREEIRRQRHAARLATMNTALGEEASKAEASAPTERPKSMPMRCREAHKRRVEEQAKAFQPGMRLGQQDPPTVPAPPPPKVEDEVPEKEEAPDAMHDSDMVFPKLEKESPSSSMQLASPAPSSAVPPPLSLGATESETIPSAAEDEQFEDVEYEGASNAESDDEEEGFLTDEEYDILDASDEEVLDGDKPAM